VATNKRTEAGVVADLGLRSPSYRRWGLTGCGPAWIGFATRALPSPMVDICQTIYFACVTDFTEHRRMSIGRYLTPAASRMSMLPAEVVLIPCCIHAFHDRSREIAAKAAHHKCVFQKTARAFSSLEMIVSYRKKQPAEAGCSHHSWG
jgi:hypothetical protein